MDVDTKPSRRITLTLLATAALFLAAGCGDDDPTGGETQLGVERDIGAQPAPGTDTFEQGLFDEIPRYEPSEPLGPRTEKNDVVAQSFQARDVKPVVILSFYEHRLEPGWEELQVPRETGPGTWRGEWGRDRWRLVVSATEAPALEGSVGPDPAQGTFYAQYSLTLEPR